MKVQKTSTVAMFGILISVLMLAPTRPANAGGEFGLHIGSVHLDFGPYGGGYVRPIYPAPIPAPVPVPVPYYNYGYYYRPHQHGHHDYHRHHSHYHGHSAYRHGNGWGHKKHGHHH